MCQVLGISKSGYYMWLKRPTSIRKKAKANLTAKIKRIHIQSRGIYSSPKVTEVPTLEGVKVSHKTVSTIMRENNICPAACATPMFLANPQEVIDLFNEANPLKRICTPNEVAKAMYFLASDESSSCNGINLEVSGGLNIHTGQPVQ